MTALNSQLHDGLQRFGPLPIRWRRTVRIIASIYPPVGIFEDVADPADLAALNALSDLVNPRLSTGGDSLALVPANERVFGPGCGYIMAPFYYLSPGGSRFAPGLDAPIPFGAYYAARDETTAIMETIHHRTRFLSDAGAAAQDLDERVLHANVTGKAFYDIREQQAQFPGVYDPDDYTAGQAVGVALRVTADPKRPIGADGIAYTSVRAPNGECVAVFRPRAVTQCREVKHLLLRWDGSRISAVFEARLLNDDLERS